MYNFNERKTEGPSFGVLAHENKIISYNSEVPRKGSNFCL